MEKFRVFLPLFEPLNSVFLPLEGFFLRVSVFQLLFDARFFLF
jgi:hypothetical protein